MTSALRLTTTLMLAILVAAGLVNGVFLPVGSHHVRPEQIVGPVVFVVFVLSRLAGRETAIRLDAFSVIAVAWVLANAVSSWLYAPQPAVSIVHVVRLSFLVAIFLTVANLPLGDGAEWGRRFRLWIAMGLLEPAYGLLTWLLARYAGVWWLGATIEPAVAGISIEGTQFERNLFGIFAATLLPVALYSLLAQRSRGRVVVASTRLLATASCLAAIGVVLSLTRSAYIALVVVGPLAYLLFDRRPLTRADRPLLQVIVGAPLLLVAVIAVLWVLPTPATVRPETVGTAASVGGVAIGPNGAPLVGPGSSAAPPASAIADRLSTLGRLGSDFTLGNRVQDSWWALNDWRVSPFLGRGTGSFAEIHGQRLGTDAWVSNLVVHTLLDTGLVGLAIELSLFVMVARRAWLAANVTRDPVLEVGLKALTLGLLLMLITYQITDGTWMAVFWIHLGLMLNGIYAVRDEQRRLATRS